MNNYIFGYGSLINRESRARTGQTGKAIPCTANGIERAWNAAVPEAGFTAVGATLKENSKCNGVLVEVPSEELVKFDEREDGYHRHKLPLSSLELSTSDTPNGGIWIYLINNSEAPTEDIPLAQSYIDIILTGCLDFGEDFAQQFIKETQGWSYPWINDRKTPRYIRALKENPLQEKIDSLLIQTVPGELKKRETHA